VIDDEIKNAAESFRSKSEEVIRAFLQANDNFVYRGFVHSQAKAADHNARNNHEKLVVFFPGIFHWVLQKDQIMWI
jgi:hypothetical protein